jgi:hypothetical protein
MIKEYFPRVVLKHEKDYLLFMFKVPKFICDLTSNYQESMFSDMTIPRDPHKLLNGVCGTLVDDGKR